MTTAMPKPWHQVVRLKDELRSGELTLAEFAADLHEVTLGQGTRPIYEDPARFFALTFPTHALRELVKDVAERLAGNSTKAVRQLELTYGGGKTHTLITLYHLFRDPAALSDVKAVQEFRQHVGAELPKVFPVSLCFDKIDVERGIDGIRAPDGETRTLKHPWSVLAFQLAGAEGLRALHADGKDEERETPPAEPLLVNLLALPRKQGLGTLILVDEVLMYARGKAGLGQVWRERIVDFFQHLVQAVTKVDRAAMVASLLASDQSKYDDLGQALQSDLFDVVRRQREEGVQPVGREDVAQVLRRRLFDADSLHDSGAQDAHVIGVVGALARLDATTKKNRREEEDRFRRSYPFQPGPRRRVLQPLDAVGRISAYPRHSAYVGDGAARSRTVGRVSGDRSGGVAGRPRGEECFRGGCRSRQHLHFGEFGGYADGLANVARKGDADRATGTKRCPGSEPARGGAGGGGGIPPFPADWPQGQYSGTRAHDWRGRPGRH